MVPCVSLTEAETFLAFVKSLLRRRSRRKKMILITGNAAYHHHAAGLNH